MSERTNARMRRIIAVLWDILALNLVVAVAKLIYGARSGAIAITADGIHSLLDASSNVVALIGIRAARRPPDADHPYGHRKYETFAALGIVAMWIVSSCEFLIWGKCRSNVEIGMMTIESGFPPKPEEPFLLKTPTSQ